MKGMQNFGETCQEFHQFIVNFCEKFPDFFFSQKQDQRKVSKYNLVHIESVTFKTTHFAFANKGQIPCEILLILTLIDKYKMYHFECHGLNIGSIKK
jgi:hypothetical protein